MQLVAYGAQDIYLTGSPQITFFKVVYRRHTNFAMESIQQTLNGSADFGNRVTCTISRNGDLVHRMWLLATLPQLDANHGWVDEVGHFLVKNVELEIGGQKIDKHYGEWLSVWNHLSTSRNHELGYDEMIGNVSTTAPENTKTRAATEIYVPLQFWFCRNPGLALPLIALQYHEVKVNLEFNTLNNLVLQQAGNNANWTTASSTKTLSSASLWCDYIYLDTDERRRFAQVSHEYLIEQLQFTGDESVSSATSASLRLNFNHPVKELVWVARTSAAEALRQWGNYTTVSTGVKTRGAYESTGANPVSKAKLQLNGHDRFAERNGTYFSQVQPYQHHTNVPSNPGVNVYSFSLRPEEHQPSGTCNFSRIDNATLNLTFGASTTGVVKVFAVNYNVLRVMSGMGGLAYSN